MLSLAVPTAGLTVCRRPAVRVRPATALCAPGRRTFCVPPLQPPRGSAAPLVAAASNTNAGVPTGEDWAYDDKEGFLLGPRAPAKPHSPDNNTIIPRALKWVELIHWAFFIPVCWLSYLLFKHQAGTPLQAFCMATFPLVQGLGALAPMALHEYEGWQIADFKEPTSTSVPPPVDNTFLANYNNQWMRQVILRFLLQFQAIGLMMFNYAVLGEQWAWYAPACAATLVAFVFGGKRAWQITPPWAPAGSPPVPLPPLLWVMGPFIAHAVLSMYTLAVRVGVTSLGWAVPAATAGLAAVFLVILVFFRNGSYVYPHGLAQFSVLALVGYAWPAALVASYFLPGVPKLLTFWAPLALVQVGGIMEAFFAEISHDHWLHAVAVWHMICGFLSMKLWLVGP